MSTRNVLITLVSVAMIAGTTACGTSSTSHQNASNSPSAATTLASASTTAIPSPARPAPVADRQSPCADLGGTVDANQICHAHTAGPGYKVTFTFPVDYPDQQALTTYLTQRREDFASFAAETPPRNHPYELDARADAYTVGTPTSGTKSLVFEEYNESGGAHPVTSYEAFNYDLGKGAPITFDTLFKPEAKPLEVLDPIVGREFEKYSYDYGPVRDNTLGAKMYQNFALTDHAVIFFIGQGQWLPQVAGPREVSVPRAELASILA
jgi:Protein of unknown function (DUF3298)